MCGPYDPSYDELGIQPPAHEDCATKMIMEIRELVHKKGKFVDACIFPIKVDEEGHIYLETNVYTMNENGGNLQTATYTIPLRYCPYCGEKMIKKEADPE